jgi:hypothetical protein
MDTIGNRDKLLGVARELYGRTAWTHKTHEKEREIWCKKSHKIKWANIILIGITTLLAVASALIFGLSDNVDLCGVILLCITSIVGIIGTCFTVYQLGFNPEKEAIENRMAAKRLLSLRDRLLLLIERISSDDQDIDSLRKKLDCLNHETSMAYESNPDTSYEAYSAASKGLKESEELTFTREEIDRMLPESLRLSQNNND